MASEPHPVTENFVDGTGGLLRQIPKVMYGAPTVVGSGAFLCMITMIKEVCIENISFTLPQLLRPRRA